MNRGMQGRSVMQSTMPEPFQAFVPSPLPPVPALDLTGSIRRLENEAHLALGRLDGATIILDDPSLLLYMYIRKEAVLSSQIEGTQSSLSDLLRFENDASPDVPVEDVEEVSSYVAALNHGIRRLRSGFPLCLRLLKEVHGILLSGGRGREKDPGEFRRSQNWIGGSRPGNAYFVPPPAVEVDPCMAQLEAFLHAADDALTPLLRSALVHVQFETIHPFLDGNGRLGRLLVTLYLCAAGILSEPYLYLSLYLKSNRARYYELLQTVRMEGDWEAWIEFFLEGVRATAEQAVGSLRSIQQIFRRHREQIQATGQPSLFSIYHYLQRVPYATIPNTAQSLQMTQPTVTKALLKLQEMGVVSEVSGKRRNRVFAYEEYVRILGEGTEPLPPVAG